MNLQIKNISITNTEDIIRLITAVRLPDSERNIASFRVECHVENVGEGLNISLTLPFPIATLAPRLQNIIRSVLTEKSIAVADITLFTRTIAHKVKHQLHTLPGVKNIIAVASGKGGVGKSTVTANLAVALSQAGARVGVLDADLYGPSQPTMFGVADRKPGQRDRCFLPIIKNGIQLMSVGFLVDEGESLVWRGPLINKALQQLFFQTAWDDLDYLLIDLPPGTGDIQLTLTQKLPLTGALIVTTPQDIALLDAKKAVDMFHKTNIPVIGLMENMSLHVCSQCGHTEAIFGQDGGKVLAEKLKVPLLGQLPLTLSVRTAMDRGDPFTLFQEDNGVAGIYRIAAQELTFALADMGKDYSHIFPKMVQQE